MNLGIVATGSAVPPDDSVVDNRVIAAQTGASVEWIEARTGIQERRHSKPGTPTSQLAVEAVLDLQRRYPDALDRVGKVIVATSTPDFPQPATAAVVHRHLGLPPMATYDVNAVCGGFLAALDAAGGVGPRRERPDVLVIGADQYSTILDPSDRRTASLFGDAAGAVVLRPVPYGFGLLSWHMRTHSEHLDLVRVDGGGTALPLTPDGLADGVDRFRMEGRRVRDYALRELPGVIDAALADAGRAREDVKRWILHQANPVLVAHLAEALGIDLERVPMTAPRYGNTGAASVPLTLAVSDAEDPIERGDTVVLATIGGGMSVAAAVAIWH